MPPRDKGVAIFAKDFSGLPARKISKKSRDRQCLRLPRFVVTSFRPNKGSKHRFQMTWRRFVKPAFSLRYASWKHMPYGYRGLKIFTSLSLRFQDFQRWKPAIKRFTIQFEDSAFARINCHSHKIWKTLVLLDHYNFSIISFAVLQISSNSRQIFPVSFNEVSF
jgi:hypothetical protein